MNLLQITEAMDLGSGEKLHLMLDLKRWLIEQKNDIPRAEIDEMTADEFVVQMLDTLDGEISQVADELEVSLGQYAENIV